MSLDALASWQVGEPRQQFNDRLGVEEWVLVYVIPNGKMAGARKHFKVALTNRLPGHVTATATATTDVYAPCVHQANPVPSTPSPENHEVTVVLRRPTRGMILQPGRGLLSTGSYENTRIEEIGVLSQPEITWNVTDGVVAVSDTRLAGASTQSIWKPGEPVSQRWILRRKRQHVIDVRGIIIAEVVDLATSEAALIARHDAWLGKGGGFTIKGNKYENLKCMRVEIQRRAENVKWLDSKWFFAKREEEWPEAGIIEPEYYAVSIPSGTLIEGFVPRQGASFAGPFYGAGDPPGANAHLADGDTTWMAVKLRNQDNDVISGGADFSAIEAYFSWEVSS